MADQQEHQEEQHDGEQEQDQQEDDNDDEVLINPLDTIKKEYEEKLKQMQAAYEKLFNFGECL